MMATTTLTIGRETPFARGQMVRVTIGDEVVNARVESVDGGTLTLYDVPDRPWRDRILAGLTEPRRVTAAQLRARGLREGWLR